MKRSRIWLALAPLFVVQSWRGRKKKRRGWPWYVMVVLVVVGVGGTLVACESSPTPGPTPMPIPTVCTEEDIAGTIVDGYIVFVNNATYIDPTAYEWPPDKIKKVTEVYEKAIREGYTGTKKGFGDLATWASAFGVTKDDPKTGHTDGAIRLVYRVANRAQGGWIKNTPFGFIPSIDFGDSRLLGVADMWQAYHELAHIWDGMPYEPRFSSRMRTKVLPTGNIDIDKDNHGNFPTDYAKENAAEDFADSVAAYFVADDPELYTYIDYDDWADDDPHCFKDGDSHGLTLLISRVLRTILGLFLHGDRVKPYAVPCETLHDLTYCTLLL